MIMVAKDMINPARKATPQLDISNSGIKRDVTINVIALMKKPNRNTTIHPSGKETNRIRGRRIKLTIANTKAIATEIAITEVPSGGTRFNPGMSQEVTRSEMASTNKKTRKRTMIVTREIKNLIIFYPYHKYINFEETINFIMNFAILQL
jgi:hypothetical protein